MSQTLDILLLGWPDGERDHHITLPVMLYLEKKYGLNVKFENIFNGFELIDRLKPSVLMIGCFSGAKVNHEITKYAYQRGIKVVSLMSEGNILAKTAKYYLWGHNHDEDLYADLLLVWSNRAREILVREYPELSDRIEVSGGTGFDRFVNVDFKNKEEFLKENSLTKFKNVVGIASWGFDLIGDNDYFEEVKERVYLRFSPEQVEMHRKDLYKVQKIYADFVKSRPDTLFILRYHPASFDFEFHEFFGIENEPNVFISKLNEGGDYSVSDLISVSDIWIAYQSTTTIEGWLMNKPTLLVNPTRDDFVREEGYLGSAIYKTSDELKSAVEEFYRNGEIRRFNDQIDHRKKAISDTIGWSDGSNFVRAAEFIYNIFKSDINRGSTIKAKKDLSLSLRYLFSKIFSFFGSKKLEKYRDRDISNYINLYEKTVENKIKADKLKSIKS